MIATLNNIVKALANKNEQLKKLDELIQSKFYEMFGDIVINEKGWSIKKLDGSEEEWSDTKIKNGLTKSSSRSSHEISESQINLVIKNIKKDVKEETIHVDTIYKLISYPC